MSNISCQKNACPIVLMTEGKWPLAVVAVVVIIAFVVLMESHTIPIGNPQPANIGTTTTTTSTTGTQSTTTTVASPTWSSSPLQVNVVDRDVLASAGLTEGTNIQTDYWWSTTGTVPFNFIQAASTSSPFSATFTMQPAWNGVFYIRTQPVSSQNYYIAPQQTMATNSCITGYDYLDVQQTGSQQWTFQCNMAQSGIAPSSGPAGGNGGVAPLMVYTAQAYSYAAPTLTNNNGGSIKSIGTSSNTLSSILYVEKTTAAKAFALEEIDIAVNNTSATSYINSGTSNIALPVETPNGGITYNTVYFSSGNINGISDGTNVWWKWYFEAPVDTTYKVSSTQLAEGLKGAYFYFALNNGSPQQIQFTTNIYTTLPSAKTLSVTEYHVIGLPGGGTTTLSDAESLCESTTCT